MASFNLAFRTRSKDETPNLIKITCFNKLAKICQNYLHKGAKVAIIGSLHQDKWQTDNGENRTAFKIIANSVEFIKTDGRGFEDGQTSDAPPF